MKLLEQVAPQVAKILNKDSWGDAKKTHGNLQQMFEELWDVCFDIANKNFNKAMALYHSTSYMFDGTNFNARDYDLLSNIQLTVNTAKSAEYRAKNSLSDKTIKSIEAMAFENKCPAGHVSLAGALKSVIVQPKVAVLTPWISSDEINDAICMQSSWGAPAHDAILKAGYLVAYGSRFKEKGISSGFNYLTDFSDIEDDEKGLTASGFSRIILALHDKIVAIDGPRDAYNFFENLVKNVEQEVGEKNFVSIIKAFAVTKGLQIAGKTTADVMTCVLANKKPLAGASTLKIEPELNITSGLELLYPFAPIVSNQWINRRQDYGFIDGYYIYKISAFKGAHTQQTHVGAKFKIMVAGDVSYVFAGDAQKNSSIMEVSDSSNLPASYTLMIETDSGKNGIETNIDDLLDGTCSLPEGKNYKVSANFIEMQQSLPHKSGYTFKNAITIDSELEGTERPDWLDAGAIIAVEPTTGKGKRDERLTWGVPIDQGMFEDALPFLKIIHGQNLSMEDSQQVLLQVQDKAVESSKSPALKKIASLGKCQVIAQIIPGLQNFLLDN